MRDCKMDVQITKRAAVLDVTPETEPNIANAPEPAEAATAVDPELLAAGEKAFKKCKACHQVGEGAKNKTGPVLNGVVDAAAASSSGFRYSKPMMAAKENGLVWTETELAEFLKKPRKYMKGTKMSFAGFRKDDDITAVIAYLKTFQ